MAGIEVAHGMSSHENWNDEVRFSRIKKEINYIGMDCGLDITIVGDDINILAEADGYGVIGHINMPITTFKEILGINNSGKQMIPEDDYIRSTNRVKVSLALTILRDVLPGNDYGITDDEELEIIGLLSKAQDKLFASYEIEPGPVG